VLVAGAGLPQRHVDVGHAWELDQLHDRDEEGLPLQRESSHLISVPVSASASASLPLLLSALCSLLCRHETLSVQVIEDPTEHNDLGEVPAYAHIVESMLGRMEELQPRVFDPDRGASKAETSAACKRVTENGGFWGCDAERPILLVLVRCSIATRNGSVLPQSFKESVCAAGRGSEQE